MKISRVWAMPNKWTFTIKPIKELLARYVGDGLGWIDPFAGQHSPAEITNDHRAGTNAIHHFDALDFARKLIRPPRGCLFDPPYSIHEVKRHYDEIGMKYDWKTDPTGGFTKVRDTLASKMEIGSLVIYFGWNSNAFGKKRGFEIIEILLVAHGGNRNDTIVTVERKIK